MSATMSARKRKNKTKKSSGPTMAETADRHVLYQESVQNVESEIDFVDETYEKMRGKRGVLLREDFCGTANTSCEWVRRRTSNKAIGVDLDAEVLGWGREHNVGSLSADQQGRVELIEQDVLKVKTARPDITLAMNFSYWLFQERKTLLAYFMSVRKTLADDGVFFLDAYGGWDAHREIEEAREVESDVVGDFEYTWDQDEFDPISHEMHCKIHFTLPDGSEMKNAFTYTWRLWSLPELQELLGEAGFGKVTIYWEGADDDTLEGNGEFEAVETAESDPGWICYLVAEK